MKNLLYLFCALVLVSCGGDDEETINEENTLTITVDETTVDSATISWTVPSQSEGQTLLYRVLLDGNEVANSLSSRTYTFTGLDDEKDYNATVYALDSSGNSTFAQTSFTTQRSTEGGHVVLSNQTDIENFYFTSVYSLTLVGEGVTDVSNLSILQNAGDITISNTSLTSLNGLQNIVPFYTGPTPNEVNINLNIRNNSLLQNINALSNYSSSVNYLTIENNPLLSDISTLEIVDIGREIVLRNIPATNFSNFSNVQIMNTIILENISPNVLTSFNSLSIIQESLEIKNIDFQNLNEFGSLNTLNELIISNCPNIDTINGIGDTEYQLTYIVDGTPPPLNLTFLDELDFNYNLTVQNTTISNLSTVSINGDNIKKLEISNNTNLQSLIGLENISKVFSLSINNNPQLTSLNGLNSLEESFYINISSNDILSNFNGLNSLNNFFSLSITLNPLLTTLDGAPNLLENNQPDGLIFFIANNTNLSDYCGISDYILANGILYGEMGSLENYTVNNNLYNPSLDQITTSEGCSQ